MYPDKDGIVQFKTERDGIKYDISPADNVYYLPNNIDIRICPKNGMSTLKQLIQRLWKQNGYGDSSGGDLKYGDTVGNYSWRYRQVQNYGSNFDLPFRKNSYRIAVRRDPIERFKSACSFIQLNRAYFLQRSRELPELDEQIDEIVRKLDNGDLKDAHFYTQTWFMGKPEDYDMVVDLKEMSRLLEFLQQSCDIEDNVGINGRHFEVRDMHFNRTSNKLISAMISDESMEKIYSLYEKDYINGWGNKEEISL